MCLQNKNLLEAVNEENKENITTSILKIKDSAVMEELVRRVNLKPRNVKILAWLRIAIQRMERIEKYMEKSKRAEQTATRRNKITKQMKPQ